MSTDTAVPGLARAWVVVAEVEQDYARRWRDHCGEGAAVARRHLEIELECRLGLRLARLVCLDAARAQMDALLRCDTAARAASALNYLHLPEAVPAQASEATR